MGFLDVTIVVSGAIALGLGRVRALAAGGALSSPEASVIARLGEGVIKLK